MSEQRIESVTAEDVKLVYVKRWRKIVKLPAQHADEIVEALRTPSQPAASGGVAELKAEIERLTDNVVVPRISEDEFPGLKATISLWMDRMIQASQAVSGSVQAVVAHPVARVRALPDALQENVLLTVEAPSGEQMTLSFPPAIADYIVSEVGRVRDELRPDRSKPS